MAGVEEAIHSLLAAHPGLSGVKNFLVKAPQEEKKYIVFRESSKDNDQLQAGRGGP